MWRELAHQHKSWIFKLLSIKYTLILSPVIHDMTSLTARARVCVCEFRRKFSWHLGVPDGLFIMFAAAAHILEPG
jgi:hypothetical protein